MGTEDADKIREALERLKNSSMEIGKAIYQDNQNQQASDADQQEEQQQEEQTEERRKLRKKEKGETYFELKGKAN